MDCLLKSDNTPFAPAAPKSKITAWLRENHELKFSAPYSHDHWLKFAASDSDTGRKWRSLIITGRKQRPVHL